MKTYLLTVLMALSASLCFGQGITVEFQNAGTPIGTFKKWLPINCSTNLTCTMSGGIVTMTASGGSMTWPGSAGIAVYSGSSSWGTSLTAPTGTIVGTSDTQTLTNKTLTTPEITQINDPTQNLAVLGLSNAASDVDYVTIAGGLTTAGATLGTASGSDPNVPLILAPKGTGNIFVPAATASANLIQAVGTAANTGMSLSTTDNCWSASNAYQECEKAAGFEIANGNVMGWSSSGNAHGGSFDTALSRSAAGVVDIGTGAAGSTAGTIQALSHVETDASFGSQQTNTVAACELAFGITTLSTAGATTTTGQSCLPANSVIDAVVYRITTTITTATSFTIGDGTTATRFCSTQSTLTAGTTGICAAQWTSGTAGQMGQSAAHGVVVTSSTTPGAGAMRLIVYYHTWTAPTS